MLTLGQGSNEFLADSDLEDLESFWELHQKRNDDLLLICWTTFEDLEYVMVIWVGSCCQISCVRLRKYRRSFCHAERVRLSGGSPIYMNALLREEVIPPTHAAPIFHLHHRNRRRDLLLPAPQIHHLRQFLTSSYVRNNVVVNLLWISPPCGPTSQPEDIHPHSFSARARRSPKLTGWTPRNWPRYLLR